MSPRRILFVGHPQSGKTTFIKTLVSGAPYVPAEGYQPTIGVDLDKWTPAASTADPKANRSSPQLVLLVDSGAGTGNVGITAKFLDPKTDDPIVVVMIRLPPEDSNPYDDQLRSQIVELLVPLRERASDRSITLHTFVLLSVHHNEGSMLEEEKPSIQQTSFSAVEDRIVVECCVRLPDIRSVVGVQEAWALLYRQMQTLPQGSSSPHEPIAVMMLHRPSGRTGFRSSCTAM